MGSNVNKITVTMQEAVTFNLLGGCKQYYYYYYYFNNQHSIDNIVITTFTRSER